MQAFTKISRARASCAAVPRRGFAVSVSKARVARKIPSRSGRKGYDERSSDVFLGRPIGGGHQDKNRPDRTSDAVATFRRLALNKFNTLIMAQESWRKKTGAYQSFGLQNQLDFDREAKLFRMAINKSFDMALEESLTTREANPLFFNMRRAFISGDMDGLARELVYSFHNFLMRSKFSKNIASTQRKIADFRFPHEWFPATRALQRTIHLHVGPTNSGKTYNALKALENAKSGIYAGPLRLLAHEVYTRFLAKGKKCALITGEEIRVPENVDSYYRSCTVEMTPLNHLVDVAVIDEIQMIGDSERGWAWTQAFLGVQAKEVHLCGEERAVEMIQSLCATTGDRCIVHRYKRLSPLATMDTSLKGDWSKLEKGDAVVTFSRLGIHTLKNTIEKATGKRVAIVYGSLPPETRAQQAALFNDPNSEYDFLVASDAIGMGLNLEIKRVIFEVTSKRTAVNFRQLSISEMKQIGGRAGRYRTAAQAIRSPQDSETNTGSETIKPPKSTGLVTTLDDVDLPVIQDNMQKEPEPLETAGIQPPPSVIERFSSYFPPNTPFSYVLARLRDIARISPGFHLCSPKEMLSIADLIQPFPMSVYDRCVFLNAPVFLRENSGAQVLQAMARCVSEMRGGHILDIPEIELEYLEMEKKDFKGGPTEYLRALETLHKAVSMYLWLSYRYSGVFTSQRLAFHIKSLVEDKINVQLADIQISEEKRKSMAEKARRRAQMAEQQRQKALGTQEAEKSRRRDVGSDWEQPDREPLFNEEMGRPEVQRLQHQVQESHHSR